MAGGVVHSDRRRVRPQWPWLAHIDDTGACERRVSGEWAEQTEGVASGTSDGE